MRGALRDLFGRTGGDQLASAIAPFGPHVQNPVRGLNDVQVVFDDHEGTAVFDEAFEGGEELGDVVEVQACGGFVADEERAFIAGLGEMGGEFDALGFATGERGGGLAEAEVAEADFVEEFQAGDEAGRLTEDANGLFDGKVEDLVDVEVLVANVEDGGLVAGSVALFADQFHVGQELHFDGNGAIALTGFAASAGDVEGEVAGGVAAALGFFGGGEEAATDIEGLDVGDGVGAGGATDGGLVDHDDIFDAFGAFETGAGHAGGFGG